MDEGDETKERSNDMIANTLKSYIRLATKLSKTSQLDDSQKEQVTEQWVNLKKIYLDTNQVSEGRAWQPG